MIQIPVTNQPSQSFQVVIPQNSSNIILNFFIYWNRIAEYWELNIANGSNGVELITGLPLITGKPPAVNLLHQWAYLNIGQAYVIPITDQTSDYPGVEDWGTSFILVWGP